MRVLSNGVQMPAIACGTGGDSNSSAPTTVAAALGAGFTHIDTAADYGDQRGVGLAIKAVPRKSIFLTTKIPGCGVPTQVGAWACAAVVSVAPVYDGGSSLFAVGYTGAGGDNGVDHHKHCLRFPYDPTVLRPHYLHPHPYVIHVMVLVCGECMWSGVSGPPPALPRE
eukprot:COSAG01_NODE_2968_length_6788_cov_4.595904_7_plen_168_part_00